MTDDATTLAQLVNARAEQIAKRVDADLAAQGFPPDLRWILLDRIATWLTARAIELKEGS